MSYSHSFLIFAFSALVLPAQEQSALEREPKGWVDVSPGPQLQGWTRLGIAPDPRAEISQWKMRPDGILECEGNRGHDWLRYDREQGDFVFHVEFRYVPIEGNPRYNSGVFVRTLADYSLWYQDQIGSKQGGYFFGYIHVDGVKRRFDLSGQLAEQRVKAAGEWNTLEVTAQGPVLTSWVNGAVVNQYKYCQLERGHIGLEGEGYRIEFRNLKLKPLTSARLQ